MTNDLPFRPYVPPPQIMVSAAEFTALRTIVMAFIAETAAQNQMSHGIDAQMWINDLSIRCQESVIAGSILVGNDREAGERLKAKVLEQINNILGGIRVTRNRDNPR